MQGWKRLFKAFLFPHIAVVIILSFLSIVGLIYSFAYEVAQPIIQYISYAFSVYALTTICVRMPKLIKGVNAYRKENRYIVRYQNDTNLRIKLSLYGSGGMNLLYSAFHLMMSFVNHSVWFYSLATYYVLLSVMRGFLLKDARKDTELPMVNQWKRYRFCGVLLIVMNLALAAIVFYIVFQNKGLSYHFIHTIAMATYTFTITTVAIVNVIRYRQCEQPIISAVKYVSMAATLVSMLSLETAMLNAFGAESGEDSRQLMTALTGAGVCVIVLVMGIYMVVKSVKEIKKVEMGN